MSYILGISAFYHDSAAAIIHKGKIIAAVQEERFTRIKHDSSFPKNSISCVLKIVNKKLSEIEAIVFYEKPFLKFERLLETYVAYSPKGFTQFSKSIPVWIKDKLFQKKQIIKSCKEIDSSFNNTNKIYFSEHHLSHAASAFYPSPFNEAVILTADGVGEWATTTLSIAKNNKIEIVKELHFPHSLGLLYSSFTYYTGFKVNSGEYKLMGLAPYGKPIYVDKIKKNLIDIKQDGSFRLDQSYFDYATKLKMINKKFETLFGQKTRDPDREELSNFHMDIAASIQKVTEEILLLICRDIKKKYSNKNICLAGGVALNCVANGKILEEKIFEKIWIQPASGDAGGSLGAALAFWYNEKNNTRVVKEENSTADEMNGSFLGNSYLNSDIEKVLQKSNAVYKFLDDDDLIKSTAKKLSEGNAVGWFQDRMEFGPRSLGSRSILGDPRAIDMQKNLNLKVKFRESFRPFAPAILMDDVSEWFDLKDQSPYMLYVSNILESKKIEMNETEKELFGISKLNIKRSDVPAVTHVDYSARIQTVTKNKNGKFYKLLKKFKEITNCPILVNTSFNVRGEPIVESPQNAYDCFIGTNLDILVIGNFFLEKKKQKISQSSNYHKKFNLD